MNLIKIKKQKNGRWRKFSLQNKYVYIKVFNFRTINTFGRDIYNGKITLKEADEDQSSLFVEIMDFKKNARPQNPEKKQRNKDILKNLYAYFEGRKRLLDSFESKICLAKIKGTGFSDKVSDHSNLKILTPKPMLLRLSMALAQVKAGNASKNLLTEIR